MAVLSKSELLEVVVTLSSKRPRERVILVHVGDKTITEEDVFETLGFLLEKIEAVYGALQAEPRTMVDYKKLWEKGPPHKTLYDASNTWKCGNCGYPGNTMDTTTCSVCNRSKGSAA